MKGIASYYRINQTGTHRNIIVIRRKLGERRDLDDKSGETGDSSDSGSSGLTSTSSLGRGRGSSGGIGGDLGGDGSRAESGELGGGLVGDGAQDLGGRDSSLESGLVSTLSARTVKSGGQALVGDGGNWGGRGIGAVDSLGSDGLLGDGGRFLTINNGAQRVARGDWNWSSDSLRKY